MGKQDDFIRITLRLPPELHRQLQEAARTSSLNAEIIKRLEESFEQRVVVFEPDANTPVDIPAASAAITEVLEKTDEAIFQILDKYGIGTTVRNPHLSTWISERAARKAPKKVPEK